ncbi:MAG: hypothetical protein PHP42_07835 [Bacteroidota bacterium]|nr:hypothetical protein [Bacteroidota bacterium]
MVQKIFIALALVAVSASAQFITGRTTTSFYTFQGRDTASAKQTYMRAYENIYLNIAKDNISFNTNAMVSNDFGSTIATDPELRVSSLMVKVRNIGGAVDLSAGRQFVFAGPGTGLIDGVIGSARFMDNMFTVTGYGGTNVSHTRDIRKQWVGNNGLFGGQVVVAPVENGSVALSYMNKRMIRTPYTAVRLDSLFNPYIIVINSRPLAEELASIDAEYDFSKVAFLQAKSDYNFLTKDISRVEAFTRVTINDQLGVTGEYIFREPRVAFNSIFSVFNTNTTQELEGGLEYRPCQKTFVYARLGNVRYVDDNSQRLVVGGSYDFLSATYTQNFGYAGELNGVSLQAVYPLGDRTFTPTVGFGYASYKLDKKDPSSTVVNATAGMVYRPLQAFSTDMQIQWMNNPQYKSDMRIFLKASYWFNERMNWF